MKMELHLIIKYLGNDCSSIEKDEVETWIRASEDNRKLYHSLKKQWEAAEQVPESLQLDFENAWQNIQSKTGIKDGKSYILRPAKLVLKIAAVLVVMAGIGAAIYTMVSSKHLIKAETSQTTNKKEVNLADGTVVFLNRNSSLTFPDKFSETREVTLKGEAFFNVFHDSSHPFVVHANGTTIKVLGTSFNIKARDSEQVVVSVLSGKVAFQAENNPTKMVQLEKGELGSFDTQIQQMTKQLITDENFLAWETGILSFNNKPIAEAAKVISEYYSRNIEVDPGLQNRTITVTFDNKSLNEVLKILELTMDINIRSSSQKVLLESSNAGNQ